MKIKVATTYIQGTFLLRIQFIHTNKCFQMEKAEVIVITMMEKHAILTMESGVIFQTDSTAHQKMESTLLK